MKLLVSFILLVSAAQIQGFLKTAEYDFIVVGGGAAGCVLAARLSEIAHWTVLLIEAGGEETLFNDIPLLPFPQYFTSANWNYKTEPSNTSCLGYNTGGCSWPRGRILGGSTVLNYMMYVRGNKKDYDDWEQLGNTGWGHKDVESFFFEYGNDTIKKEMIKFGSPCDTEISKVLLKVLKDIDNNSQNQTGWSHKDVQPPLPGENKTIPDDLSLEHPRIVNFILEVIKDNSVQNLTGCGLQATINKGLRWSAYRAFLEPVRHRRNLHIVTNSMVTRVLINNGTAYGVEYKWWNLLPFVAHAKKEVLVSAGAINSPQLLMLSGIGPADHLRDKGIPVIKNLSVGYNLQDHVSMNNFVFTTDDQLGMELGIQSIMQGIYDFLVSRSGIFTSLWGDELLAFIDVEEPGDDFPEIELILQTIPSIVQPFIWYLTGARPDIVTESFTPLAHSHSHRMFPILMRPYSRGRIMLKNQDPYTHPVLNPNYFSDHRDIENMIKGIRIGTQSINTTALKKHGADLYRVPLSTCKEHEFDSDSYWECCIRYLTQTFFHPCGTCKMGPDSDPDAVVDHNLKVRGIKHLRVVDASIMPIIVTGHLQAPVYMIAEKIADQIKKEWGQ